MKDIEEQIAEIIKQDHYSNSKIQFTETVHRILSEVIIEIACNMTFCRNGLVTPVSNIPSICSRCKGTDKQTITLEEGIQKLCQ